MINTIARRLVITMTAGFSIILAGCGQIGDNESVSQTKSAPVIMAITDMDYHQIAWAISVSPTLALVPDHVWQTNKEILINGDNLEVAVRDFVHDILFFDYLVPDERVVTLSSVPPFINQELSWLNNNSTVTAKVIGVEELFAPHKSTEARQKLIMLEGVINPGDSGLPIFDEQGLVWGILMGADPVKNVSYALRSDVVRQFLIDNFSD